MLITKIKNTIKKYLPKILRILSCIILDCIKYIPFISVRKIRNFCYRFVLKEMGKDCNICEAVTINYPKNVSLGKRVSIHPYTMISANGGITIGDNVGISSNCAIAAGTHIDSNTDLPIKGQGMTEDHIFIDEDVMMGPNVTIVGNTIIGKGCVIRAGAVVSGEIPPYSIVVGNPGRVAFNRKTRSLTKDKK